MDKIHQVPSNEMLVNTFSSTKDLSSADSAPKKSRLAISQGGKGNNKDRIEEDWA